MDGAAKATAETPFSLKAAHPTSATVYRWCLTLYDTKTPQCLQFVTYTQKCLHDRHFLSSCRPGEKPELF